MKNIGSYWKSLAVAGVMLAVVAMVTATAEDVKTAKPKAYPLKTCIVTGEKLDGAMGKPIVYIHEGQEFKLCCQGCVKDFKKDPAKWVKKLAEAQKAKKDAKPITPADAPEKHQH